MSTATRDRNLPTLENKVIQVVSTETGAVATGTTTIPTDDTIPQNTEGDQYMTLAITPKSATSSLLIQIVVYGSLSASSVEVSYALFRDSVADALATVAHTFTSSHVAVTTFTHIMTSPGTSTYTFKVRAGPNSASTFTFNGSGGSRDFGGVAASSIVIQEIQS